MVEKLGLPCERLKATPPDLRGCPTLPPSNKAGEILRSVAGGRGEEVDMIRHRHIASDDPAMERRGIPPGGKQNPEYGGIRQHRLAVLDTNGQKKQRRPAGIKDALQSAQMPAFM
jgi:hypothetical protein